MGKSRRRPLMPSLALGQTLKEAHADVAVTAFAVVGWNSLQCVSSSLFYFLFFEELCFIASCFS
jgi:hypothetical protein